MTDLDILKKNLPAHPGIQFREEYVNTAVMVLLAFLDAEYHFVFQKRAANIRQNGEIGFPGGVCQAEDKTAERTALRETVEEMGIPAGRISVVGRLDTLIAPMGAIVDPFVGVADIRGLEEFAPNPAEVAEVFSIPVSYFEANPPREYWTVLKTHPSVTDEKTGKEIVLFPAGELGLPERYHKPWGGMRHAIYVYEAGRRMIWGLTARLILDLTGRLKA
jgi:8-oxo-dGTP pyrophosphatase MutT (NUDIX family)